jgi:hypothetical protein
VLLVALYELGGHVGVLDIVAILLGLTWLSVALLLVATGL